MPETSWSQLASELTSTLHLAAPPLAITFSDAPARGCRALLRAHARRVARRPHRTRARRLRVLDEGGREHVQHRRRGPRQLQRRQHDARVQDPRRGRGQLRRRRAARVGLGHDGRRPADPGGAREAGRGHLRTARRDARRPRRRVPARDRSSAHGAVATRSPACASKASRSATSSRSPRKRTCPPRASAARSAGCAPACRPPR